LQNDSSSLKHSECIEEVEYEFDWLCSFEDVQSLLMYLLGTQVPDFSDPALLPPKNSIMSLLDVLRHQDQALQSCAKAETHSYLQSPKQHMEALNRTFFVLDLGSGNSTLLRSLKKSLPEIVPFALDYSPEAFQCLMQAAELKVASPTRHSNVEDIPCVDLAVLQGEVVAQFANSG
jgi:hypothetical protein